MTKQKIREHMALIGYVCKSTFLRNMGILVMMGIIQWIWLYLSYVRLDLTMLLGPEDVISHSRLGIFSAVGLFALCASLALQGTSFEGNKLQYTLMRLKSSELSLVAWQAMVNGIWLMAFWAVQVSVVLCFGRYYCTVAIPSYINDQTLMLMFYRQNFLHSLMPLADVSLLIRNIVWLMALSLIMASFSYFQRRQIWQKRTFAYLAAALVLFPSALEGRESVGLGTLLGLAMLIFELKQIWGGRHEAF